MTGFSLFKPAILAPNRIQVEMSRAPHRPPFFGVGALTRIRFTVWYVE